MALQCFWMLFQTVERAGMFDEKEAETSEDGLEIFFDHQMWISRVFKPFAMVKVDCLVKKR